MESWQSRSLPHAATLPVVVVVVAVVGTNLKYTSHSCNYDVYWGIGLRITLGCDAQTKVRTRASWTIILGLGQRRLARQLL